MAEALERIKLIGSRSQRSRTFEWSPSGENIALISPSGHLSIWDVSLARSFREINLLQTSLFCLAWSPDSRRIAIGADAGTIVYDVDDLRKVVLGEHVGPVTSVAWCPSGNLLATGGEDKTVRLRDGITGESKALMHRHEGAVTGLAWAHDGEHLASVALDGTLCIWRRSGELVSAWALSGRSDLRDVEWSPGKEALAVAAGDGSIQVIDPNQMRPAAILEGHTGAVTTVSYSADGEFLLSRDRDGILRIWSTDSWKQLLVLRELPSSGNVPSARFHPGELEFGCLRGSAGTVELWRINIHRLLGEQAKAPSVYYTNAKIVLLGDTGVGKSGLSLVLTGQPYTPTDSTHGRKIWKFDSEVVQINKYCKEVRDTLLWDLAGQPGYRLVHQLSLNEMAIAVLVFDSRSETDPFGSVRYWDRAVRLEDAKRVNSQNRISKLLVAARVDRGGIGVSQKRIDRFVDEIGAIAYLPTSAKQGTNISQLRDILRRTVDWQNLPRVTSTDSFYNIKNFLLDQKQSGVVLASFEDLYTEFLNNRSLRGSSDTKAQFLACVRLADTRGLIRRLSFGDLVLLQPELLDIYASAMVNEAREEPDGLGYLTEDDAKEGRFPIPTDERITDCEVEKLLLIATIEELLRHEVAFKDISSTDTSVIIFPAQFTREWPEAPDPRGKSVVFSFEGPIASVYCTLVIRLARSGVFRLSEMWKNAAVYEGPAGTVCGVFLLSRDEGRADLTVFYRGIPDSVAKLQFEEFVNTHLIRKSIAAAVQRRVVTLCDECQTEVTVAQVKGRRERGFDWTQCNVCGTRIPLREDDGIGKTVALADIAKMDRAADSLRDKDVATETLDGKLAVRDFDVFLCYSSKDRFFVRQVCQDLKVRGVLPWLDEEQIRPGQSWQRVLEADIRRIRCAAVFVGANGVGPWQNQEIQALLQEFVGRRKLVIPVIVPNEDAEARRGVLPRSRKGARIPLFLKNLQWVDFRDDQSQPLNRLVWGVTGIKN